MAAKPKALIKAEAYAKIAEGYGLEATIKTEHVDAEHYSHGGVMLPGYTIVWLTIKETDVGIWGDVITAGWSTKDKTPGFNATTRWISGWKSAALTKDRKFASETKFANWLHIYTYKTAQAAK